MKEGIRIDLRARRRNSRRTALFVIAALLCVIFGFAGYVVTRLQSAAFQEGNPVPFIVAIDTLNSTGSEIVAVGATGRVWLQRNQLEPAPKDAMTRLLATRGWELTDVMGAGRTYSCNSARLKVVQRMYTTKYIVFRAESTP